MNYSVPNMKLIVQDQSNSCWFASGQMLINWRQQKTQSCEVSHPDPALVEKWGKKYDNNARIFNEEIRQFAADMGLEVMPPMTPTPQYVHTLLVRNGPLWVNGFAHITVIAGIRDLNGSIDVLVFDPGRGDRPNGKWHNFFQHYNAQQHTKLDAGSASITAMLYLKD